MRQSYNFSFILACFACSRYADCEHFALLQGTLIFKLRKYSLIFVSNNKYLAYIAYNIISVISVPDNPSIITVETTLLSNFEICTTGVYCIQYMLANPNSPVPLRKILFGLLK